MLFRSAAIGVVWPNNRRVAELAPYLDRLALVVLVFPTFKDGRAYSQARLLRERLGYTGGLRATGAVFLDQLPFLLRCGFDSFESDQPGFGAALEKARTLFSVVYQPAEDGRTPVSVLRRGHRVTLTREPGGTRAGESIRAIFLDPAVALGMCTTALA